MMEETSTGAMRIKGSLPAGTVVAHRTGRGGRDPDGKISAVNDVGIITLPDNSHLALVVYISNSPQTTEELEQAIARISKELFDHYSQRQ
jgi:beta-lactamase class A